MNRVDKAVYKNAYKYCCGPLEYVELKSNGEDFYGNSVVLQ